MVIISLFIHKTQQPKVTRFHLIDCHTLVNTRSNCGVIPQCPAVVCAMTFPFVCFPIKKTPRCLDVHVSKRRFFCILTPNWCCVRNLHSISIPLMNECMIYFCRKWRSLGNRLHRQRNRQADRSVGAPAEGSPADDTGLGSNQATRSAQPDRHRRDRVHLG